MSVTIDLRVVQSLIEGGGYRVKMDVLYATGIAPEIFVYTADCNEFSHVATPFDIENIPYVTSEEAELHGYNYYRKAGVIEDRNTVESAEAYSNYTKERVAFLAREFPKAIDGFEGTNDYTYTG
ncbi:MAG: hypothetical protein DRP01_00350 [Archaeoglobales archaeon]|nr:MAG: hypothetical protein DRP01_00350 [Archaeoglobales archaeon]